MRAYVIKESHIKKLKKEYDISEDKEKKGIIASIISIYESLLSQIVFIKVYEGNDIDLKIKFKNNHYRYVKIVSSSRDKFDIIDLDLVERKISRTDLFTMIYDDLNSDKKLSPATRNEILKYIDFKRNRKRLLWLFYNDKSGKLYPMNENAVKDLIVNDIESLFLKKGVYRSYSGSIPVEKIDGYWQSYIYKRKRSELQIWKDIVTG